MLGAAALVLLMAGLSVSLNCPDGKYCPDTSTCCKSERGYGCCPYPHAVCCPDLSHCCPEGFQCNMQTQMCEKSGLQATAPMLMKVQAEEPSIPLVPLGGASAGGENAGSLVVRCDATYACPDGMTCCHHPAGGWSCCIYSPAQCCLDGYHCCPYGYQCDRTYTHCLRGGVPYPFLLHKPAATVKPTKAPVVEPRMSPEDE
ncbi:progranulin-like [Paramormyrops kingsleyae]|uniref:progranulin-like n=1 Tax=Paramormyrops kingsleyae TaxID=1676925 RepID=UPI000CD5D191|nr:granulins-like [Paramormyrops kingsleyae]